MKLSIVAAMSENRVIGRGSEIPWRLRDEQLAIKELTLGHCLLMGRKTWDSIGRPLPARVSIVITRDPGFAIDADATVVVHDFDAAVAEARERGGDEAFVFGGEAIYALALPRADRLYLTRVHAKIEGDIHFPAFDESDWKRVSERHHPADDRNEYAFTMEIWDRQRA